MLDALQKVYGMRAIVLQCLSKKNRFNKNAENKNYSAFLNLKNLKNKKIVLGVPRKLFP